MRTIGILGGGQLGRMTAEAATRLGFKTHIYSPDGNACAFPVADDFTVGAFDDTQMLETFARSVDVITYEFENVPAVAVDTVAAITPVYPNASALRITQNRVREKSLCRELGIPTAPWREVKDMADARSAMADFGAMIIKTSEMGYDGKGQWKIADEQMSGRADEKLSDILLHNKSPLIAEGFIKFDFEISVIVARGQDGEVACYPPVRNEHRDHMLWQTHAPAVLNAELAARAECYARQLAEKLDIVGLLAVEMFVVGDEILVNEMAPRPHNSGHWTMEGAATSQFEQLVRAVTGMKLGDTTPRGNYVMQNLIGDEIGQGAALAQQHGGIFRDYGKTESRPGRKMGHVTWPASASR